MNHKQFVMGLLLGMLLVGCAGFTYRYYGLEMPTECYEKGKLLDDKPSGDLPLTRCMPDDAQKGKCAVFLVDELERLIADHGRLKAELKDCQKECK